MGFVPAKQDENRYQALHRHVESLAGPRHVEITMKRLLPASLFTVDRSYPDGTRSREGCPQGSIFPFVPSMGSFDTITGRMDLRGRRQHGLFANDPSTGFYDTSLHGT